MPQKMVKSGFREAFLGTPRLQCKLMLWDALGKIGSSYAANTMESQITTRANSLDPRMKAITDLK